MSDVYRIVLTSAFTIIGGVVVFGLGHLCVALFVDPIHRLRSLIGEIEYALIYYADVYSNPQYTQRPRIDEASGKLRMQASQLRSGISSIPWYPAWQFLRIVPSKNEMTQVSRELIGLSNLVASAQGQGTDIANTIRQLLGIESANQ